MTDPADMPEDEHMTPAELKVVREFLGMSTEALGAYLRVVGRSVRHWEDARSPIPDGVRLDIERLEAKTETEVDRIIGDLMEKPHPTLITYATDEDYHAAVGTELPASWHRALCARVAQEVPGLSIRYAE